MSDTMPTYYRMLLGSGYVFVAECLAGNFVGINFGMPIDFTGTFGDDWQQFNKRYIPSYLHHSPDRNRIAAGLACASLYTVGMKMQTGDYVISPVGNGSYRVGQISGAYHYVAGSNLPHRRNVQWLDITIPTPQMSSELIRSCGSPLTVINLSNSGHAAELKKLINSSSTESQTTELSQPTDLYAFALEKHLEEFIVRNWHTLALGQQYELTGQQYPIGDWYIDILATSKDKKKLLVIELKRGRGSDEVVGQILRYMGYVKESIAEPDQTVHGVIIAHEDDPTMQLAISMITNVTFYQYHIQFSLTQGNAK